MLKSLSQRQIVLPVLALNIITLGHLFAGKVFAAISEPETVTLQSSSTAEAREILERASQITLQGLSALQKAEAMPSDKPATDEATHEALKKYMASLIYVPHAAKLPSDTEALDEPWVNEENPDGLVLPHVDDPVSHSKGVDIDVQAAKKFLKLLLPVQNAFVSSGFGIRWGRPHQGIDMAAPLGTPIRAAESGKVVYSGWKSGYGNFIAVDHGHGYLTHYAHCSRILVHSGQLVKKGQEIGKVGNTGNSTGPHLHFEVLANGVHRNPAKFFNQPLAAVNAP
jgi:murein DD-endopeptidase MepM/ murein hydrolase activator NlpD